MNNLNIFNSLIYKSFPPELVQALNNVNTDRIEEIRIRAKSPVIVKLGASEIVLKYIASIEDVLNILQSFCSNSIYTYQSQICNGFITIQRTGIESEFPVQL